jgi:transcriptional regulator with XRE-family HTH domain
VDADTTLRAARRAASLTLRELAARAGTSHSTLAAYESGTKVPTVATLSRILRAAGADVTPQLTWRAPPEADRGDELAAVLRLAGQFPARHEPGITMPPFGHEQVGNGR